MAISPNTSCPECKYHDGIDRPNLIYRSGRGDYVCGYCTAVYNEVAGKLALIRYEELSFNTKQKLKSNRNRKTQERSNEPQVAKDCKDTQR